MRYPAEHKAATRTKVLRNAAGAIRERGVDRVSVAALMSGAGLTHGGFYAHFRSKDDLLSEAVEFMFADMPAGMRLPRVEKSDAAVLTSFLSSYLSTQHVRNRTTGCPIPILAGEMHRLPDRARQRFEAAVMGLRSSMAGALEQLGVSDAANRAEVIIAEMIGAVSLARVSDETAAERILQAVRTSILRGLELDDDTERTFDKPQLLES